MPKCKQGRDDTIVKVNPCIVFTLVYNCSGVLRTGSEKGPHNDTQNYSFVNNSTSIPQIDYWIAILFKSPGSNVAPLCGIGLLNAFAERQLLYTVAITFVLARRRDLMVN